MHNISSVKLTFKPSGCQILTDETILDISQRITHRTLASSSSLISINDRFLSIFLNRNCVQTRFSVNDLNSLNICFLKAHISLDVVSGRHSGWRLGVDGYFGSSVVFGLVECSGGCEQHGVTDALTLARDQINVGQVMLRYGERREIFCFDAVVYTNKFVRIDAVYDVESAAMRRGSCDDQAWHFGGIETSRVGDRGCRECVQGGDGGGGEGRR